jgi:hypothetical protein
MNRTRSFRAIGTWCLATVGVAAAQPILAATAADVDAALDYDVDSACPGRDRFVALVDRAIDPTETSPAESPPSPTTTGLRLQVEIRATPGGYRGSMAKLDRSGSSEARVIAGPICSEVAQALALTAAFSLAPAAAQPAAAVERRAPPAPPPPTSAAAAPGSWLVALGASGGAALSTDILTGLEGSGGRTFPVGGAALPFMTSIRLRTAYTRNDWVGNSPVARFALWTVALEACALMRPFGFAVEAGLCASGETGWLRGRGVQVANPRTTDSLWLAFGAGPLVRVPLGPRWRIEARGAAIRPLRRAHFSFESPAEPVAETPTTTWMAALALVARFP